jgi:SAM-dependent methyltransferase
VQSQNHRLVLDIGGSAHHRFGPAHKTIGWEGDISLDLMRDRLPFDDGEADFVYCRHTIEDLADPTHLLSEIQRIAKAGHIETPSPLAETTRGVDAQGDHVGYAHHRWLCASDGTTLVCLAKYPIIERLPVTDYWDLLQHEPLLWNTYHEFTGLLKFQVLQHESGINLNILKDERNLYTGYLAEIERLAAMRLDQP